MGPSVIDNITGSIHLGPKGSSQVDNWLFMSNPGPVLIILSCYLYFILKLGPEMMSTRKPYNAQKVLVAYNLYQILFNIWLTANMVRLGLTNYTIYSACYRIHTGDVHHATPLYHGAWWYFVSKLVDLLDTVFFVLRKKQNQVTFLHVYHHTSMCLFTWGYLKYLPGEQGIVIAILNSAVHVLMYSYYMLAALGPKYAKHLWWKKYLTAMQLIQFCLMLTYLLSLLVFDCRLSKSLTLFILGNVTIFLYLFNRFYKKTYRKKMLHEPNTDRQRIHN